MRDVVYKRDPLSQAFDGTAERLLLRAYGKRGEWVSVRLKDPTIRERSTWLGRGINVDEADKGGTASGGKGLDAKTRWARGLVRSLYYLHKNAGRGGALQVEVGRHIPASPQFDPQHPDRGGFPPSRQFRVRIATGGQVALRAVKRLPDSRRIYDDEGNAAARWADPARRDWG